MDNSESFALIDNALSDVDRAIESLDLNAAAITECEATIATLQRDIADLRANKAGLESKARGTRLTVASSLLSIAQADRESLATENAELKQSVVTAVEGAKHQLQELWAALLKVRKEKVSEMIVRTFDTSKIFLPSEMLTAAAYSVVEIDEMKHTLFAYRLNDEAHLAILDARLLRQRSLDLVTMAEANPTWS